MAIQVLRAVQSLQRSVPTEHKDNLKQCLKPLGWKGFKMEGLTPNKTRRAQVASHSRPPSTAHLIEDLLIFRWHNGSSTIVRPCTEFLWRSSAEGKPLEQQPKRQRELRTNSYRQQGRQSKVLFNPDEIRMKKPRAQQACALSVMPAEC